MNKRNIMIYLHLGLASLFMPLMLLMPFTGASYIWDFKGEETSTVAFQLTAPIPENASEQEAFFRDQFKQAGIDYNFEYFKASKTSVIFRPQTRLYYSASPSENGIWNVSKVEPDFMRRLIEIHKGHGPSLMKTFEGIFGIALILTTLSGLWLSWTVKAYRKVTIISFSVGVGIIALCLF